MKSGQPIGVQKLTNTSTSGRKLNGEPGPGIRVLFSHISHRALVRFDNGRRNRQSDLAGMASYLCPDSILIGHSLTPNRLRRGYTRQSLPRVPTPRSKAEFLGTLARFAVRDKSVILLTQGLGAQSFHGRVVILVNEWTNGAAEMLAGGIAVNQSQNLIHSWRWRRCWQRLITLPLAAFIAANVVVAPWRL